MKIYVYILIICSLFNFVWADHFTNQARVWELQLKTEDAALVLKSKQAQLGTIPMDELRLKNEKIRQKLIEARALLVENVVDIDSLIEASGLTDFHNSLKLAKRALIQLHGNPLGPVPLSEYYSLELKFMSRLMHHASKLQDRRVRSTSRQNPIDDVLPSSRSSGNTGNGN